MIAEPSPLDLTLNIDIRMNHHAPPRQNQP